MAEKLKLSQLQVPRINLAEAVSKTFGEDAVKYFGPQGVERDFPMEDEPFDFRQKYSIGDSGDNHRPLQPCISLSHPYGEGGYNAKAKFYFSRPVRRLQSVPTDGSDCDLDKCCENVKGKLAQDFAGIIEDVQKCGAILAFFVARGYAKGCLDYDENLHEVRGGVTSSVNSQSDLDRFVRNVKDMLDSDKDIKDLLDAEVPK